MSSSHVPYGQRGAGMQMAAAGGGGAGPTLTAGARAAANWLRAIGGTPVLPRWNVEIALEPGQQRPPTEFDERTATRFQLDIYNEEWGFLFCDRGRASWIRITDVPFVHGRDDFLLLARVPALNDIGTLVRELEQQHAIKFQRAHASIKTNLAGIESSITAWVRGL